MKALALLATAAAIAMLAGCGTTTTPAATRTGGTSAAAAATHSSAPPSCHQQYGKWKNGPARPLATQIERALKKVGAAAAIEDIPALNKALKDAGNIARRLAAYPMPRCADPKAYWTQMLGYLKAAGDNASTSSGLGGLLAAMAPLEKVKAVESKLGAELKKDAAAVTPARTATPAAEPTFAFPGSRQCAITYRDNHNGTMSWTATVTIGGQLITHVSDKAGNIYRHVTQVTAGPATFTAPVPLPQIDDIGGV